MTDQPGRPPEERLFAPVPMLAPVTTERFTAPPSTRRNDLTPERAAKIVRQSANARWVAFLAVTIVGLFVMAYYFYELGLPGNLSQSRLEAAADAQQVTSVERGYNIYQANCAQCHGANGEGGKGPTLNRQDKLFAHLSVGYITNVLQVGGRYVCGNPNSIMPIWSNTGNPAGPLNYRQIQDLIAFIRAEQGTGPYRVMDPGLFEPVKDPVTQEEKTIQPWVDPNYQPAPGATPYPACWTDEFTKASASPGASEKPSEAASEGPGGAVTLNESAVNLSFEVKDLTAPQNKPFDLVFENKDAGIPHNIDIKDAGGGDIFVGEIFPGVATRTYQVPALQQGNYTFVCTVHPNMTGTLVVGN